MWLFEILKKRSWKVYAFMFGVFLFFLIFSYFSSQYLIETEPEKVKEFLDQISSSPLIVKFKNLQNEGKYDEIALLIFIHNSQIALINYFFGIGFVFSVILQASNGFLLGFLLGTYNYLHYHPIQILEIFIVMILEVTAITAIAVEGMYLTYTFIRPKRMWNTNKKMKAIKKTLSQSLKIILLSILILLISAIIETLFIYYEASKSIEPIIIGV